LIVWWALEWTLSQLYSLVIKRTIEWDESILQSSLTLHLLTFYLVTRLQNWWKSSQSTEKRLIKSEWEDWSIHKFLRLVIFGVVKTQVRQCLTASFHSWYNWSEEQWFLHHICQTRFLTPQWFSSPNLHLGSEESRSGVSNFR